MTSEELLDQLAAHRTLGSAPREELAWLAAHGTVRHIKAGEAISEPGRSLDWLFVVLSGRLSISVNQGAGRRRVMEWRGGDVSGLLPYSRMVNPPGANVAEEPVVLLAIHRDQLTAMIRECHEVTSILVHKMLDRARVFTSTGLQDEKMASLGRLAAGLAHELNNPAAALERSASLLEDRLEDGEKATRILGAARLTDAQLEALDTVRKACLASPSGGVLSPIQQAEREDAIADWLADHGVDPGLAETLADTAVTIDALDRIATSVDGPSLDAVLRWAAAGCAVRGLASEMQEAAMRIAGLVQAVKGFTHMDQATVSEPVDLMMSLTNTVTVLRSKARGKSVAVTVDIAPGLPLVRGFAGELSQIWANLIDNALDAVAQGGRIDVTATCERRQVVVRVVDDGAGIPEDVRARIFEPFFTTKPIGKGTGLGLDIVRRLVIHNDGEIEVESRPGRTEFRVSLPMADDAGGSAK